MKRPYVIPPAPSHCALCLDEKPLCLSHVIPEFAYKSIYDEKHRMIAFNPENIKEPFFEQKGFRSHLLCADCERYINENFEMPFYRDWHETNRVDHFPTNLDSATTRVDYARFKLFHLSVLWRADVSRHPAFWRVSLGPHAARIRQMLLNLDAGPDWLYPIVCGVILNDYGDGIVKQLIESPQSLKLRGHRGYAFTFSGCHWIYFVGSHPIKEIDHLRLRVDGTLPAGTLPVSQLIRRAMRSKGVKRAGK